MSNEHETKTCKYCKTEIHKDAKVCPQCRRSQNRLFSIAVILIVALVSYSLGSGNSKKDSVIEKQTTSVIAEVDTKQESQENSEFEIQDDAVNENQEVIEAAVQDDPASMLIEMCELFEDNALKASETYKNQYVQIRGRFGHIGTNGEDFMLYPEKNSNYICGICYIQNEEQMSQLMEMSTGDYVTLSGWVTEIESYLGYRIAIDSIDDIFHPEQ